MKPYWRDEKRDLTIYHGRCEDLFPQWGADRFGSVIADSPYGVTKEPWDIPPTKEVIRECLRVAEGTVVMFGGAPTRSLIHFLALTPDRVLVWAPAFSFAQTRSQGLMWKWQPIFAWRPKCESSQVPHDVLRHSTRGARSFINHPAKKPLPLMRDLVAAFGGRSVLDCYMGSGTTLAAAAKLGVPAVGVDCEERYCEMAAARLSDDLTYGSHNLFSDVAVAVF